MKRKNIIRAAAGSVLAVLVVGGYFATRTYAYTAYGATTAISNYGMAAMTNPNEPTNINAAQSYDLKMNGTRVWELNEYAAPQSGANPPPNLGYMFVAQSQLPANPDGSQTSFSGGYGNEQFVAKNLINGSQYTWAINESGTTENGSNYYALSDILDMNGMTAPAFNGLTVWPTGGQNLYAPQTSLSVGNVALPHIAPTLTDSSGAQVSTIAPSGTYYINPGISHYGSNGGGYFSKSYLSAYWLPVSNGTVGSYQYALTTNNSGSATIYGWPDPLSVQASGGLSSATGYFSGFPGGFEQVPYGTSPTQAELAVKAPSTFSNGVTAYDLVVYYGDSVERYDAQVLQVQAKQTPQPPTSTTPTLNLTVNGSSSSVTVGVGQMVTLTGTASILQSGKGIFVHDMSSDKTISGTNVGGGTVNVNPESVTATDGTAQTVTYEAAMNYISPTTGQTTVIHSNPVQVTYTNQMSITLTGLVNGVPLKVVKATNNAQWLAPVPVGTTIDFVATATNMPSTDYVIIYEIASGKVDVQGQPGQNTVSTPQVRYTQQTVGFEASIVK